VGRGVHASIWPANGKRVLPLETTDNALSAVQQRARRAGGVPCGASSRVTRGTPSCNVACGAQRRQPSLLHTVYRRRQREALSAAYPRDPPRASAGLGRARACKSAAYRLRAHCRVVCWFVSLPICAVLARTCFLHFPSCLYVLLVAPPRMTHHTPCGRATVSVGHAHDAGCASRLCTHLGSLRPTISGAASTSSAKCAIWRSDDSYKQYSECSGSAHLWQPSRRSDQHFTLGRPATLGQWGHILACDRQVSRR
jgi:hypothetical protein